MSLFEAAKNNANSENEYDRIIREYNELDTPEKKLKYLTDLRKWANNNPSLSLNIAFHLRPERFSLSHWIREEKEIQKERIKDREYLSDESNTDSDSKEPHPTKIIPENKFYEVIDDFHNPITNRGVNSNLVDKILEQELVGYKYKDTDKKNPQSLKEITIRRRIREYLEG